MVEELKTAVIGLGSGGMKVLDALAALPAAEKLALLAVDVDADTLNSSRLPKSNRYLADFQWQQGRGCGGDPQKGQRSLARERENLEKLLGNLKNLIVVGGLGGGFASGGVEPLNSIAAKLKLPVVYLLTSPFSWEGQSRWKIAESAVAELLPTADVVLVMPNDLLFSTLLPETPAEQAFRLADNELARAAVAVAELLNCRNLVGADYADLKALFKARKSFCSIGVGVASAAESANFGQLAVDRMLSAPLLGGSAKLKEADAVVLSILGGSELSIADLQQTLNAAAQCLGKSTGVVMSVNTSPEYAGCVLVSAIAVKFSEKSPVGAKLKAARALKEVERGASAGAAGGEPTQLLLELASAPAERGIFTNSVQVVFNGEDLDVPTFQRKEISIDLGD